MSSLPAWMQNQACPIIQMARSKGSIAVSEQTVSKIDSDQLVPRLDESRAKIKINDAEQAWTKVPLRCRPMSHKQIFQVSSFLEVTSVYQSNMMRTLQLIKTKAALFGSNFQYNFLEKSKSLMDYWNSLARKKIAPSVEKK